MRTRFSYLRLVGNALFVFMGAVGTLAFTINGLSWTLVVGVMIGTLAVVVSGMDK